MKEIEAKRDRVAGGGGWRTEVGRESQYNSSLQHIRGNTALYTIARL